MRRYFVSYTYWRKNDVHGVGNCEVLLERPVNAYADISNIEKFLASKNDFSKVVIGGYQEIKKPLWDRIVVPVLNYIAAIRAQRKLKLEMDEKLPQMDPHGKPKDTL